MSIEQLMIDAIDLHVHGAPKIVDGERRIDLLTLAHQAKEAGMKAVVIKSNRFGTGPLTLEVNQLMNGQILLGSLVLNKEVGGLNPDVVEAQARAGAKVIWLPTFSAAEHIKDRIQNKTGAAKELDNGISIIDEHGKLVPQMGKILEVMRRYKLVLATGHVSKFEVYTVAKEALRQHINVIITHPLVGSVKPLLNLEEAKELAGMGAYIENIFAVCMPPMLLSPEKMAGYIKTIGPEHCVLATDFGQIFNPPATEGFHMMLAIMLMFGLSEDELRILVKENPAKILGLD